MEVSNSASSSNKLIFDGIVGVILNEDMRRKSSNEASSSGMNLIVEKNKGRQRERCKYIKGISRGRSKSRGKGKTKC